MVRVRKKILLVVCSVPLWLGVFLLAGEAYVRFRYSFSRAYTYYAPRNEKARARDMAVLKATAPAAPRPPPELVRRFPVLAQLNDATDAEMAGLAAQWHALILEVDGTGTILRRFAVENHAVMEPLIRKAGEAQNVVDLLGPGQRAHCLEMLAAAMKVAPGAEALKHYALGPGTVMEYCIDTEASQCDGFQFYPYAYTAASRPAPAVMVIIPGRFTRDSPAYRPHFYMRDWYPEFDRSEFWTNGHGLRDEAVQLPKQPNVYRIVCVGGSTTVGGPRNDLTYPNLLEQKLGARLGAQRVEVINAGVDGIDLRGCVGLSELIETLKPDMILRYGFVNDAAAVMEQALEDSLGKGGVREALAHVLGRSQLMQHHARWLWRRVFPGPATYREKARTLLRPALQALHDETQRAGAQLAIASFCAPHLPSLAPLARAWFRSQFVFALPYNVGFDDYIAALTAHNAMTRAFCAEHGLVYIPVQENLHGGIAYFTDIAHMHLRGIDEKAAICADHLQDTVAQALSAAEQGASGANGGGG